MPNKKQQFLLAVPRDNTQWAAQQIIGHFTEEEFMELQSCFAKLDKALYKGWANEMTFAELKGAAGLVAELSDIR